MHNNGYDIFLEKYSHLNDNIGMCCVTIKTMAKQSTPTYISWAMGLFQHKPYEKSNSYEIHISI